VIFWFTEDMFSIVDFGDSGKCLNAEIEFEGHFISEIRCLPLSKNKAQSQAPESSRSLGSVRARAQTAWHR